MADEGLFADFVRDRGPALYRYGYLLTGSHHDADDLVQEALIRVRAKWARLRVDDPVGYVRTTMARLHVSWWRRRRETPSAVLPEEPIDDREFDRVETSVQATRVWAALASLPPRQRAVVVLRYYESLSDDEISTLLGVSRGTVRSQAARGLDKLRAIGLSTLEEVTS